MNAQSLRDILAQLGRDLPVYINTKEVQQASAVEVDGKKRIILLTEAKQEKREEEKK